jgi:BlaI family penicillinase repressor
MKPAPRISEAEWEVMEVLWRKSPLTSLEIVRQLGAFRGWKDQTIRTMLSRLIRKKAVAYTAEGRVYRYRAAVTRARCVQEASDSFLARVFSGAAGSLLLHFARSGRLKAKDLAELRAVLHETGGKSRK